MTELRAGIIGLGVGERHLTAYASHPDCRVVALCDTRADRRAEIGAKYPDIPLRSRAEEVLDDPRIDVVSIASYDDAHFAQAAHAIRNGKHVFVEKPLCLHDEEASDLRRLLEANPQVRLSSNLVLRTSPRFKALKEMIETGDLGELYHVEGDYNYGRLQKLTEGWRGQIDYYSVVHGGAVHMVDLLLWLTEDRIEEVKAYGNQMCSHGSIFRFNDIVVAVVRFASGLIGKISANFGCVMPHAHGLAIYGTKKTFVNSRDGGQIIASRDPGQVLQSMSQEHPGKHRNDVITSFVDFITRGSKPLVSVDEAFRSMSVCMAIEKATQQEEAVKVIEY